MAKFKAMLAVILLSTSLLAGCGGQAFITNLNENDVISANEKPEENNNENKDEENINSEEKEDLNNENTNEVNEKEENPLDKINLDLKPNEAGQVMVLMYHGIDSKEDTWVRTPENFRKDLENLYNGGYRPISFEDFINNDIKVEEGFTPVVLTFDDGNLNNFNITGEDESGKPIIDPNCAVGILEEFNNSHPDFPLEATFFINGSNPFRQAEYIEYKLNYIVEKGMDIGNHSLGHNNLSSLIKGDEDKLQKYIGAQAEYLESLIPNYKVNTLALPFGSRPKDKELYKYLAQGEYDGIGYENIAILNVGWMPSVSPLDKKFDKGAIHRVRASEIDVDGVGMYDWMSSFDKHPERRFISDGNPNIITVPKKYEDKIDLEKVKDKTIYIYEE